MLKYFAYSAIVACLVCTLASSHPSLDQAIALLDEAAADDNATTCSDTCKDTITDCLKYIDRCLDPNYFPIMKAKCPCTCLLCDEDGNQTLPSVPTAATPDCMDVNATQCQQIAYECQNPVYKPLMCQNCMKTCNFCNDPCASVPTTTKAVCADVDIHGCQLASADCDDPVYKPLMCKNCRDTCHFCNDPTCDGL